MDLTYWITCAVLLASALVVSGLILFGAGLESDQQRETPQ